MASTDNRTKLAAQLGSAEDPVNFFVSHPPTIPPTNRRNETEKERKPSHTRKTATGQLQGPILDLKILTLNTKNPKP